MSAMARLKRYTPQGIPQHVIQRGNNRQICFGSEDDMAAYAQWLHEAAIRYGVSVHAWVFMSNHVHLLVTPEEDDSISLCMQSLERHYVRYFNYQYNRTGTLFEGRFKSCPVQSERYFLVCQRYIELNPVRAGMVSEPADYLWSSYRSHAFSKNVDMWTPHREYLNLASAAEKREGRYRALFSSQINGGLLTDLRLSTGRGMAFGSERFKDEMEALGNRRQRVLKRGPKSRS
jgi:putative transposase